MTESIRVEAGSPGSRPPSLLLCGLLASAILLSGVVAGILAPAIMPNVAQSVGDQVGEFLGLARGLSTVELFLFVFLNNTVKSLVMMYSGLLFGLIPAAFLFVNGMAIAIVIGGFALSMGVGAAAAALVPHGVLEIPAVVIAAALGLRLGISLARRLRSAAFPLRAQLTDAWRVFSRLLVPVLLLAALIETWITPLMLGWWLARP